ncbi:extracellular solute-binding protein [Streptomyces sp. NBC_01803]|uniref:extracellular solute-binding protein n=1 Tax=Streptomyces sp. NBC_01803 TaxID=2975946 RepID=UPI002DD7A365|nr:extracellular solute-binding protein [Streptomyces sp. NBC_01803]WSA42884.1 extracellular solute-binding protein [Streptomyces sp. NBC_01803]
MAVTACWAGAGEVPRSAAGSGTGDISVWAHQGTVPENEALIGIVADFNRSQDKVRARLRLTPPADYTGTVLITEPADLPDVLEFDGPTMASLVANGKLTAITPYVSSGTVDNATDTIRAQGMAGGELYGLGMYDSGLGVYGDKSQLDAAGVDYPRGLDDAWSAEEFTDALGTLAARDDDGQVLDIRENDGLGTEWGTFGFSPVLWSAGGGLLAGDHAAGVLDTRETAAAFERFQEWKRYVHPNPDGTALQEREVALSWAGHWVYGDYAASLGSDLVVMPLPDFGNGVKTGQGSWAWGIGANTKNGTAAGAFLDYLLGDERVARMTEANTAPPGTRSALAASPLYGDGGPLRLFAEQLDRPCGDRDITPSCVAVTRPVTPGYPVITSEFSQALTKIYGGDDPRDRLSGAARAIDRSYADNDGYELP